MDVFVHFRFISVCSSQQPLSRQPNSKARCQHDHRYRDKHDGGAKREEVLPLTVLLYSVPWKRQHLGKLYQRFTNQNSKQKRQDEARNSSKCVHALGQVKDANHLRGHHGVQDVRAEDPQQVNGIYGHGQGGRQRSRQKDRHLYCHKGTFFRCLKERKFRFGFKDELGLGQRSP